MVATAKIILLCAKSKDWFGHRPSWKRFTLCIAIAFSCCHLAANNTAIAATYYVDDTNGRDDANGLSWTTAWKTLLKAQSTATGGDIVTFKGGNYGSFNETTLAVDRTDWITYQAATDAVVAFDGIYIKDNGHNAYLKFVGITINGANQPTAAVSIYNTSYTTLQNCTIYGPQDPNVSGVYSPYYPENTYGILIRSMIEGYVTSHILIDGCTFSNAFRGIQCDDTVQYVTIQNCTFHRFGEDSIHATIRNDFIIQGCNFSGPLLKESAEIKISGTIEGTFTKGEIVTQASTGAVGYVDRTTTGLLPVFQTTAVAFESGNGKTITGPNGTLSNPTAVNPPHTDHIQHDVTSTGEAISGIHIWRNIFFDGPAAGSNSMIALVYYAANSDVKIINNLIYDTNCPNPVIIEGTDSAEVINNTILGNRTYNLRISVAHHVRNTVIGSMYNNIIKGLLLDSDNTGYSTQIQNHGNNIFGNNPSGIGGPAYPFAVNGTELVNYNINSLFVSAANNDFNLAPNSAAINFGNSSYGPATDILGRSRVGAPDAGCYEYITSDSNNHAPVLETIGNKSVSENSLLTFAVSATDADGDAISYSAQNLPSGATFVGQTFSWTPGYNQAGTYPVTFIASDSHQATDSETIVITVSNTNRPPVLAAIGNKSVNEGNTLSFSISATDADGDTITYSAPNRPSGAAFAGQTFSWTPGYNQAGTYQVTFIASDGQAQDSQTITITVNNVNQAPILSTVGSKSVYTNTLLAFGVNATDADGDTVAYSATGLPSGATFAGQSFGWTPAPGQAGTYQITFLASDSRLQDSEAITITVYSVDTSAPAVSGLSPVADSIQAPLNILVILHVADNGEGVDANSVTIKVNSNTVYTGNTADYSSQYGHCRRTGTKADYAFIYQPNAAFDYDQTINMAVNARDLAGNAMSQYSYSFTTEMRSFGKNKIVNSGSDNLDKEHPATVRNSAGDIWAAWHAGPAGSREVYVGKLASGADGFDTGVRVANNSSDKCNAAVAIDASDKLYLAWQDNRRGNWDIYLSTSVDGINWSSEKRVTDSNNNAINPAIVVDHSSPPKAYIVWQDDRAGNQDLYIASSSNSFATETISRITSNSSNQIEPAIAVNAANTVYVVWADSRNISSSSDIYGAASNNGSWTNVPIVTKSANQTSPAIATEAAGAVLHLVWVDDTAGNKDIYYATSTGLPTTPLTGKNIVDDSSGADQLSPAIITTGSTGSGLRVSACWQDKRNAGNSGDTDLYFVEVGSSSVTKTNIFVGDDATNSNQATPVMGIDGHGYPYLLWADGRNQNTDIYYAGSTFVRSSALASRNTSPASGATIGADPAAITGVDDVSVVVPPGAYSCELNITISKVENPPKLLVSLFSFPYEFGPSGTNFDQPVTVTIPYSVSASDSTSSAYWYDKLTGALSQQGITDVEIVAISPTLYALRFKTTHFTQFIVGGSSGGILGGGGGGGGGGCALSSPGQASPVEFLLPYIGLAAVMIIINRRDRRNREIRRATGNMH